MSYRTQGRNSIYPYVRFGPLEADWGLPEAGLGLPEAGSDLLEAGLSLPEAGLSLPEAGSDLPKAGLGFLGLRMDGQNFSPVFYRKSSPPGPLPKSMP